MKCTPYLGHDFGINQKKIRRECKKYQTCSVKREKNEKKSRKSTEKMPVNLAFSVIRQNKCLEYSKSN